MTFFLIPVLLLPYFSKINAIKSRYDKMAVFTKLVLFCQETR